MSFIAIATSSSSKHRGSFCLTVNLMVMNFTNLVVRFIGDKPHVSSYQNSHINRGHYLAHRSIDQCQITWQDVTYLSRAQQHTYAAAADLLRPETEVPCLGNSRSGTKHQAPNLEGRRSDK